MMRPKLFAAALLCMTCGSIFTPPAHAGNPPRYLVLSPSYKGHATPLTAQAYAYGWFGAMPSSESFYHRYYNGTTRAIFYSRGY